MSFCFTFRGEGYPPKNWGEKDTTGKDFGVLCCGPIRNKFCYLDLVGKGAWRRGGLLFSFAGHLENIDTGGEDFLLKEKSSAHWTFSRFTFHGLGLEFGLARGGLLKFGGWRYWGERWSPCVFTQRLVVLKRI